jgi:hypothetical protein
MIMSEPARGSGCQADCFSPPPADDPDEAPPPSDRGRLPAYPPERVEAVLRADDARLAGFDFAGWGPDDVAGHESVLLMGGSGEAQADDLQRLLTHDFADGNSSLYSVSVSHEPLPTEW